MQQESYRINFCVAAHSLLAPLILLVSRGLLFINLRLGRLELLLQLLELLV